MSKIRELLQQLPDNVLENDVSITISLGTLSQMVKTVDNSALVSPSAPFGERLRAFREDRGYTVRELADSMGLSESTVRHYENGNKKHPLLSNLFAAAEILEVSPSVLLPSALADSDNGQLKITCDAEDHEDGNDHSSVKKVPSHPGDDLPW